MGIGFPSFINSLPPACPPLLFSCSWILALRACPPPGRFRSASSSLFFASSFPVFVCFFFDGLFGLGRDFRIVAISLFVISPADISATARLGASSI